jgi:predicted RND superfamily exporter protein
MPSLVYVLGLSGAVHIVNYYRDAVEEHGVEGAAGRALAHGWKPCTLAAFTTALGLLSLNTSNILPIRNFGFYSALGVMATLILLFTFLPSALQIWPPRFRASAKSDGRSGRGGFHEKMLNSWEAVGGFIVRRHGWVAAACLLVFAIGALGLPKLNTSVHLIKLFDGDAKIIRDYAWLEDHLGKLVPMELVVRVQPELMQASSQSAPEAESVGEPAVDARFQLNFLERMEIASRIQNVLETTFGEAGQGVVGRGMSVPTFAPDLPPPGFATVRNPVRSVMNRKLEEHRSEYLASDYLKIDREKPYAGSELWRISLRLGALMDVDYGQFVSELKRAVEPVLTAYDMRSDILERLDQQRDGRGAVRARIALLGYPDAEAVDAAPLARGQAAGHAIDQTRIFADTLRDLMVCAGASVMVNPAPKDAEPNFFTSEKWQQYLAEHFDGVILVADRPEYNLDFIRQHAQLLVDARGHRFDPASPNMLAAVDKGSPVHVVYTGVVPIVYKAQRTLLTSLIDSIGWAFVMIAVVMMALLRTGPLSWWNLLNVRAGLISMIPNVFPIVLIFGAMGHAHVLVDIGTMMTASVAMGVAVDDTIHFLTWFRDGVAAGLPRHKAITEAYRRCAAAMTQTTLIGGLGLAVFAFSTFTPTQYFGTMMLALLVAALIGDLIFLPALLAGPLGRAFCPKPAADKPGVADALPDSSTNADSGSSFGVPHIDAAGQFEDRTVRKDRAHRR